MGVYIETISFHRWYIHIILYIINKYDCKTKTKSTHKSLLEEITRRIIFGETTKNTYIARVFVIIPTLKPKNDAHHFNDS